MCGAARFVGNVFLDDTLVDTLFLPNRMSWGGTMKDDWVYFYKVLLRSIKRIDSAYFELDRYNNITALRERVYCYGL
jgi:hypothetical protein